MDQDFSDIQYCVPKKFWPILYTKKGLFHFCKASQSAQCTKGTRGESGLFLPDIVTNNKTKIFIFLAVKSEIYDIVTDFCFTNFNHLWSLSVIYINLLQHAFI